MKRFTFLFLALVFMVAAISCQPKSSLPDSAIEVNADWFNGRPLYEVYVRSFSEQGTFNALKERLPELKAFGIQNIWLMPVHPIGEKGRKGSMGCPYSVKDYFEVGQEYGTSDDLKSLIEEAHRLDMRVLLDMVINHSANDHVEMENHPGWFCRDEDGNFTREVEDWWDITDWDFDNPATHDYLKSVLVYYIRDVGIDGFRCDVAGMVPHEFWKKAIDELKTIKPDVYLLAEWHAAEMINDGFHSTYDWDLYHRLKNYRSGKISIDSLWNMIESWHRNFPMNALPLRFVENHDENRSAEVFGWPEVKPFAALVFTLPGVPLIYNGQEVGATHKPSLFEKESINWKREGGAEVAEFYGDLLRYRNSIEALQKGDLKRLEVAGWESGIVFQREYVDEVAIVAINFSGEPFTAALTPDVTVSLMPYSYEIKVRKN